MPENRLIEDTPEERRRAQDEWEREIFQAREAQKAALLDGVPALRRLFEVANGHSGQCSKVAAFLLGLYNGDRFPFDMTNFRAVDKQIFDDMMLVLRMDSRPMAEVHTYFPKGGQAFEQLAQDWNLFKREWDTTSDQGFMRRKGAYRLNIEPRASGESVTWEWRVSPWDREDDEGRGNEKVASGKAWSADDARRAIDEWFDRGGENPHEDE